MARRTKLITNPALAVAYIRVSTDDQALGPDAQRAAINRWAGSQGVTIADWHEDIGVSGGAEIDRRPGLMGALQALTSHSAGLLVVAKRDRLARDVVISAAVERLAQGKGARVLSADGLGAHEGPEGALMRGLVDLFAQYERALIRSRTKAALSVKKARGERVGDAPIGYRVGDDGCLLQPSSDEQQSIGRIRQLHGAGMALRAIADAMTEEGFAARGKRWHATTISRVLERSAT